MPSPAATFASVNTQLAATLSDLSRLNNLEEIKSRLPEIIRGIPGIDGGKLAFGEPMPEAPNERAGWHEIKGDRSALCAFCYPIALSRAQADFLRALQVVVPILTEAIRLRRLRNRMSSAKQLIHRVTEELVTEDSTLEERLDRLAKISGSIPGAGGAIVIALDKQHDPIAAGYDRLQLLPGKEETRLETLNKLADCLRDTQGREVPPGWILLPETLSASFYPIHRGDQRTGYLLVAQSGLGDDDAYELLADLANFFHLPIREALQRQALDRLRALRELANELRPDQLDLSQLVHRIREIFKADTVSLWLEAEKQLHLSASTDPRLLDLANGRRVYERGQGLTGNVWSQNRSVSVFNTHDREHIARELNISAYKGATHMEVDDNGQEYTQYLGVPIRSGGTAIGVLRLVRSSGSLHFSPDEQSALEFFGELLGLRVDDALRRQILETIWQSEKVALIASHRARVTLVNRGAERLFANVDGALVGKPARELYVAGDFSRVEAALREAVGRREGGVARPLVVYFQSARNERSPAELSLHLLQNKLLHPPLEFTLGVASDISEQYSGAAGFAQLIHVLDKTRIVFIRSLSDGRLVYSNQAEELVTGYSREELMEGRQKLWIDPNKRALLFAEARLKRGEIVRRLVKLKTKDERPLTVWTQVRLVREGDVEILEGLYEDVSGRLKLQDWLSLPTDSWVDDKTLLDRLEEEAKNRLHYQTTLGHQIKSPLFALVANLRMLEQSEGLSEDEKKPIGRLISETLVAWRQIGSFFDLDDLLLKESLAHQDLRHVYLVQLILQVVDDFNHVARQRNLRIVVEREGIRPHEELIAHPRLLTQLVGNLIDNAVKYSRPSSVVYIRAARDHQEPGFEISSRGAHVEPDERDKLFTRGFRGRRASGLAEGSGLGLWFARRVLELHKGTIQYLAESEPSEGSRNIFVVRLKRQPSS